MRDELEIPYPTMGNATGDNYTPRDYRGEGRIDPNTKRMAIIAGGIGAALLVIMSVWSLTGHRHTGVPVIEADSRPVRVKPVNQGGMEVAGADETILSGGTDGKAVVAPAPEAPAIAALKATPPQNPAPAPMAAEPVAQPLAPADGNPGVRVGGLAEVPLRPMLNASRSGGAVPAPAATPPQVAAAPAAPPVARPAVHGATLVQLAAVGSEEAAMGEWKRLAHKYPELLGGRAPSVSRTERDGKTYWRLRVAGFADTAVASSFCGQMKAKGGSCAVARF